MSCITDCWELGPPPDMILFLPPPPLPAFLQRAPSLPHDSSGTTFGSGNASAPPCAAQLCDRWLIAAAAAAGGSALGGSGVSGVGGGGVGIGGGSVGGSLFVPGGDFVDLPRQEWGNPGSGITAEGTGGDGDTWLLVLIGCIVGVLLLGALLALFLMRCREAMTFNCRQQRHTSKAAIPGSLHHHHHHHHHSGHLDHCAANNAFGDTHLKVAPIGGTTETVLYPTSGHHGNADNRLLWAALTPRGGTQHFISETYPQDFLGDYAENENTYETIDNFVPQTQVPPPVVQFQTNLKTMDLNLANEKASFDNSGFVDYDYEDPTPLIESYQLDDIENRKNDYHPYTEVVDPNIGGTLHHSTGGGGGINAFLGSNTSVTSNTFSGTLRRAVAAQIRPRVSSPTRIENPNLPPLNLHPQIHNRSSMQSGGVGTLRRGTLSRRGSDGSTFGKQN